MNRHLSSAVFPYPWASWGEGAKQKTAEVKSYSCNDWGLYEMHGNVWGWCDDNWQESLGKHGCMTPGKIS